ncbi:hypothetical protein U1Q18_039922 [Sarracenia purpurea var. burkii]
MKKNTLVREGSDLDLRILCETRSPALSSAGLGLRLICCVSRLFGLSYTRASQFQLLGFPTTRCSPYLRPGGWMSDTGHESLIDTDELRKRERVEEGSEGNGSSTKNRAEKGEVESSSPIGQAPSANPGIELLREAVPTYGLNADQELQDLEQPQKTVIKSGHTGGKSCGPLPTRRPRNGNLRPQRRQIWSRWSLGARERRGSGLLRIATRMYSGS